MRRLLLVATVAAAFCVAPAAAERAHTGYPNAMVVIGHSGATGFNSDPARPGRDALENSWATGTNPAVGSVYLRLLALDPAIRGHSVNLARDGAKASDMLRQAQTAVKLKPKSELILFEGMDNDIRCDVQLDVQLASFRSTFTKILKTLAHGLPNARILVMSQYGRPATYALAIQGDPAARATATGPGDCDLFDETGNLQPAHVARLTSLIESYERVERDVCASFVHCRNDGGAFARVVDELADLTSDYNHLSPRGHAKAAAAAWSAMFDFGDTAPPTSAASRDARNVTLTATEDGVRGIEYKLTPPRAKAAPWFTRYAKPVVVKKRWTLTWRAVDVNGNSERTHSLRG